MRALVIGRGSMGKRRIRDLTALGVDVESWDIKDGGPNPLDTCPTGPDFPWQAVCLCTPPLTKAHDVRRLIPAFTEADVESFRTVGVYYPSCTPLFTDWYPRLFPVEEPGPLVYTLHVGQHIDDWHPGAGSDYYGYRDDLPLREMLPFELVWLTRKFGGVTKARGLMRSSVALVASVEHERGVVGSIVIDIVTRPAIRRLVASGDGWTKRFDLAYTEAAYFREMQAFVASVKGEQPWPYSASDEAANLAVLSTIESPSK